MTDVMTYCARARSNNFAVIERPSQEVVEEFPSLDEAERHAEKLNVWMKACDEQAMLLNRLLRGRPKPGQSDDPTFLAVLRHDSEEGDALLAIIDRMHQPEARAEGLSAAISTVCLFDRERAAA